MRFIDALRSWKQRLIIKLLSKSTTDVKSRKVCLQCEVWRELFEQERSERRELQQMIFVRFGVTWKDNLVSSEPQVPIQHHRASQVLHELEAKKRQEAIDEIKRRAAAELGE